MNRVLILDANSSDTRFMSGLLTKAGYEPIVAENMDIGKKEVAKLPLGAVVVTAMRFHRGTARELIKWLKAEGYRFPVIAVVDNLNGLDAIEVMQDHGAVAVVQRPALDKQLTETVGKYVRPADSVGLTGDALIPRPSDEFRAIEREVSRIAASKANVIIFGESGMGKEHIAREIYRRSNRTDKPLTVLEAGGAALVGKHDPASGNSEMYNRIKGYFNNAAGGTIIIKNIHLLNFDKQSVFLHILSTEHPDVRVICTAEPELLEMVTEKTFRPTLFFHLREVDITVPPLRKTSGDIVPIAEFFLYCHADGNKGQVKRLDASAVKALKVHIWPGNIRELRNVILLAADNVDGDVITATDLPISHSSPETRDSLRLRNPNTERQMIADALTQTDGNLTQAAKLLGIGRSTMTYKVKQYGLKQ
ncbi:sigma-54-dependent transcriptional regulator [Parabacteroides sp.]